MTDLPLYHFTDTARLAWILKSGELQPGRNKIGDYPDPDFLWATSEQRGDLSASAGQGSSYRNGLVRHVRFTLVRAAFIPWVSVPEHFHSWTSADIVRLEKAASGRSSPRNWWCRATPLPLDDCLRIETRSYMDNAWKPLPDHPKITDEGPACLAIWLEGKVFISKQVPGPSESVGYQVWAGRQAQARREVEEPPMTEAPFYYSYFTGHGRELLAETLGDAHPFTLSGSEIVERVLAAGYTPDLDNVWREPFPTADAMSTVHREGQLFIVSIDIEHETIAVQ